MTPLFKEKVRRYMPLLMSDFGLSAEDAAAVFGNIGHECNGFATLQEISPVVKGSRGGYGWSQWTGPRRRAFEAYCQRHGLDPRSDKANYAFLFTELKGTERGAIPKLKAAKGLSAKVVAFEQAFLRAGIKHYPSRLKWAEAALDSYKGNASKVTGGAIIVGGGAAVATQDDGSGLMIAIGVAIVIAGLIGFIIWKKARR